MAKLAAPLTDDQPESAVGVSSASSPVEMLALLTSGATFGGISVRSVRIELADGRVQRLELPEVDTERPMSKLAERLLDILRDMPDGEWTSGAALARMADPTGEMEHHSGTFKRAVDDLRKRRLIDSGRKGYRAK